MTRFAELAESFSQDSRGTGFDDASSQLFTEAHRARDEWDYLGQSAGYRTEVEAATRKLAADGVLPVLSAEYLSIESDGQTNFEDIADNENDDGVISRDELKGQISELEDNDATFSAALAGELKTHFGEIAAIDGQAGISMSDYQKFILQERALLSGTPPVNATAGQPAETAEGPAYTVKSGDGFDRIARRAYMEAFGERPSIAIEIELSRRIAELNGNDRDYSKGYIQPGQSLIMMNPRDLGKFVAELKS